MLVELLNDMSQKGRAGVAQLPALEDGQPRVLYLLPPGNTVCGKFGLEWSPREMLVGVVSAMDPKMAAQLEK